MRIIGRPTWKPVGGSGTVDRAPKHRAFIHHSAGTFGGPPAQIDTLAEQSAVMRAIDRFHTHDRGWAGIGYSFVVFQAAGHSTARIFRGRGGKAIPAAQLGDNTGTIAVCVIDGAHGDPVKDSTLDAIVWLLKHLRDTKHFPLQSVGGHRDARGQSTECPGPFLYPKLNEIARRSGLRREKR